MDVYFASKHGKRRFSLTLTHKKPPYQIVFDRGMYHTSDKEEIEALLSHPGKKRGDFDLYDPNPALVAAYLDNEDLHDKFTKEYLKTLPNDVVEKLGKMYNVQYAQAPLIRAELVGVQITTSAQNIITGSDVISDLNKILVESDSEVEVISDKDFIEDLLERGIVKDNGRGNYEFLQDALGKQIGDKIQKSKLVSLKEFENVNS